MTKHKLKILVRKYWRQWRGTLFLIVFVVIPVKSCLADFNWIPSGSMNPTILEGDFVFVNKAAYDLRVPLTLQRMAHWADPQRGDIVICFSPEDRTRLIKRVVGLPGDTIEMQNNHLYINGAAVTYSPIESPDSHPLTYEGLLTPEIAIEKLGNCEHPVMSTPLARAMRTFGPVAVPEGQFFVMGDNRDKSRDSRFFGFVPRQNIVGKALGIVVSFDITEHGQPRLERFFSELE